MRFDKLVKIHAQQLGGYAEMAAEVIALSEGNDAVSTMRVL